MRTRHRPRYTRAGDRPGERSRQEGVPTRTDLKYELWGLATFAVGIAIFLSSVPEAGFIPGFLRAALHWLVGGLGAGLVALALIGLGGAIMLRLQPSRARGAIAGTVVLFLVVLGFRQLFTTGHGLIGRAFAEEPGGAIGVLLVEGLRVIFGPLIGGIMLGLAGLAGVMLVSNLSLGSILRGVGVGTRAAARSSWQRLCDLRERECQRRRLTEVDSRATPPAEVPPAEPAVEALPEPPPSEPVELPAVVEPTADAAERRRRPPRKRADDADQLTMASEMGTGKAKPFSGFRLPPLSLLTETQEITSSREQAVSDMEVLERTLSSFGIDAKVVEIERGPRVTRYEIQPPPGVRVTRITNLADDLALALAALDVRVEAPVPGKGVIGIEVPNRDVVFVGLRGIMESAPMERTNSKLAFALGKDISGHPCVADLAKMPHLLIAGATNSGKSVCLNSMIASILLRARPDEVKFLLVDPKRVELSLFEGIPHLVAPVAHDAKEAAGLLRWAIREMEHRYELFAERGVRNIVGYNEQAAIDADSEPLFYLVIVIDELADLMMQAAAEFEGSICRLAQLARATGIHLVVATQRPSVNVITGTIKANISSRVAFAVASQVDSRTILDMNGAERLVGSGDMLFLPIDASKPTRIQGAYIDEKDTGKVAEFLRTQAKPEYSAEVIEAAEKGPGGGDDEVSDELFEKALDFVLSTNYASTSMLQRKLRIGYTRAARLMDLMEARGYVGPADGSKPREILKTRVFEDTARGLPASDDEEADQDDDAEDE